MVMVQTLLGLILLAAGIFLYRKNRRMTGGLMMIIGGSSVLLGIIAVLSFHP